MEGIQHFILTRFNIRIWTQDKNGKAVRTKDWLKHRFDVFEKYCLPSIANQTCKDFEWIVLFDSETPLEYKDRIFGYRTLCPQLSPVFVEPSKGRYFRQFFRASVVERIRSDRVITTYLDNDDALSIRFVEDLQRRAASIQDGTFIFYTAGFQYFTEFKFLMQVIYKRNHFVSVIETGTPATLQTIYGYGSHYYIDRIPNAVIEYVPDLPLWCEVIHERNMGNDAHFLLGTKAVRDSGTLSREFSIDDSSRYSLSLYVFKFIPRYIKTLFWRIKCRLFGRKW